MNVISDTYSYYFDGPGQRDILGTAWGAVNAISGYYSNICLLYTSPSPRDCS